MCESASACVCVHREDVLRRSGCGEAGDDVFVHIRSEQLVGVHISALSQR